MTSTPAGTDRSLQVADVMRPAVSTVERPAHLAAAAYLMKHAGASALVVINSPDERVPIGIITETDIAHAVADGRSPDDARISDLISGTPVVTQPDTPVAVAAQTMVAADLRQLPVVDHDRLVGIIDITDACRGLLPATSA